MEDTLQVVCTDMKRFMRSDSCNERLSVSMEQVALSEPDSAGRQYVRSGWRMVANRETESGGRTDSRTEERLALDASHFENVKEEAERQTCTWFPFSAMRAAGYVLAACIVAFVLWRRLRRIC